MSPSPLLQLHHLSAGYAVRGGENNLFKDINLTLNRGELVCFMGSNGAGKSTLLRTLAGLQSPLSGTFSINENNHHTISPEDVAIVLTDPVAIPNMTVWEMVSFGRYPWLGWNIKLKNTDRGIIDQSIAQANISYLIHSRTDELSDGQRQMVMIARALAQDTPLLLLDEPTSHLDLNNRVEVMRLLKQLARKDGKAVLVATHELDLALQTADRLWLAKDKTILSGIPEDLILDGTLDDVFQFKGYDLKTGKLAQEPHRGVAVKLMGDTYVHRWTKNALERNGFLVTESEGVEIVVETNPAEWRRDGERFTNLHSLLNALKHSA